jgi:hypothetical protein
MNPNINELVNFEKLKKCNDLCHKWANRLNIPDRKYLKFIYRSYKNPLIHLKNLEIRYRCQFVKDCKIMFYAAEVEEILIKQYHGMVMKIISSMRVASENFEDFITEGYNGIRSAAWQYRTHKIKASFTTFVFKAIFYRIKGKLHKDRLRRKKNENIKVVLSVDLQNNQEDMEMCFGVKDCAANMDNPMDKVEEIIKKCSLTNQEAMLLRCYVNRKVDAPLWNLEYKKKYLNIKTNKQITKQSVLNHLNTIRGKIYDYMKKSDMLPEWFVYAEK